MLRHVLVGKGKIHKNRFEQHFYLNLTNIFPVAPKLWKKHEDPPDLPEDPIQSIKRNRLLLLKRECKQAQPEFYYDIHWCRKYWSTT